MVLPRPSRLVCPSSGGRGLLPSRATGQLGCRARWWAMLARAASLLAVLLLHVFSAAGQEDCRAKLAALETSKQSVDALLRQVDTLISSLEEQLGSVQARLETAEDADERARLEELAIRLAEQAERVRDQRAEVEGQLVAFEEALNALGECRD